MEQEHTPLRLEIKPIRTILGETTICNIYDKDNTCIFWGFPEDEVYEFIVRACNSHYELLEACKLAYANMQISCLDFPKEEFDEIEAAIAKAEPEKPKFTSYNYAAADKAGGSNA